MTTPNKKPYKDDQERQFKCHARKHMTPSEYVTYDSMLAMALSGKKDGTCYAKRTTIANHSGQTLSTVKANIKALVQKGWLIPEGQKQARRWGEWSSNKYYVMEHDEFPEQDLRCPPFAYDPVTGEPNFKGVLKPGLARYVESKKAKKAETTDARLTDSKELLAVNE